MSTFDAVIGQIKGELNSDAPTSTVRVRLLGHQPYAPVWHAMQQFTAQRTDASLDELWCVEHSPVFTQGQAGKPEHLLAPGDIPVIHIDRGGQVTYHGPGQAVVYTLINLTRRQLGIKTFVSRLEDALLATLLNFHIQAERRTGAPGLYLGAEKIAAIGLRVKRGCTYHGLSLNVNMDLEPFTRIRPCGLNNTGVTQISAYRHENSTVHAAHHYLIDHLCEIMGYTRRIDDTQLPDTLN